MNIVVAEDDPGTSLTLVSALKSGGHEVMAAPDGAEALTLIRKYPVDLVVTDWVMPHVSGPELCRSVRALARESYIYIVLLTSLSGRGKFLEGMESGADSFLRKPVDREELEVQIRVAQRIVGLHQHVARLEGLLSVCSYCKQIRDDAGSWVPMEQYIGRRTELKFSHGVCVKCKEKVMADFMLWDKSNPKP